MTRALALVPDAEISNKDAIIHDVEFELSEGERIASAIARKVNGWFGATWGLAVITNRRIILIDAVGSLLSMYPAKYKLGWGGLVGRDDERPDVNLRADMQGSYEEKSHFNKYMKKVFN